MHIIFHRRSYGYDSKKVMHNLTPLFTSENIRVFRGALNVALFGMTAKEYRSLYPKNKGNIRDTANVNQLVCLANLESLNAHFIYEKMEQSERIIKLNKTAISQMKILVEHKNSKKLGK